MGKNRVFSDNALILHNNALSSRIKISKPKLYSNLQEMGIVIQKRPFFLVPFSKLKNIKNNH